MNEWSLSLVSIHWNVSGEYNRVNFIDVAKYLDLFRVKSPPKLNIVYVWNANLTFDEESLIINFSWLLYINLNKINKPLL